ncbi:NTP transferase domain-containing protein [Methanocella arvoryzae]|uniref:Nucleotidyltransferase n=1 Tax=Methanocella arvoryzae (strain DSM 22066 / NBRC 105507 / MRE50) TaxID=351160 RepID=Q0W1P6_METAR|nr:NTP transferase domain-containing protein [Methanocella arvoryzae]CAJ37697.1 putative nucleotidyltransferase [Methanocella arvoryzae MRE50]
MAGGRGVRLNSGEKPLAELKGKPLIAYVIDALLKSREIGHVYVAVSQWTPCTCVLVKERYRDEKRVSVHMTPGAGYIDDTVHAVKTLELFRPFLIISSDIPLVKPETIDAVVREYEKAGAEALSVRVARSSIPPGVSTDTILIDNGVENVPAAINVIDGRYMDRYQQEALLILEDPLLAANVNYIPDISVCERLLTESSINRQVP